MRQLYKGSLSSVPDRTEECLHFRDRALEDQVAVVGLAVGHLVADVRKFLIAFNIKLNTSSVDVARKIAGKIRESNASSGLDGVKAMGVFLESQQAAQVSVNVTDYEKTPLSRLFRRVADEARREGTEAVAGEIVGLIPRAALESDPEMKHAARIENFHSDVVLETRLAQAGAESGTLLDLPRNTK